MNHSPEVALGLPVRTAEEVGDVRAAGETGEMNRVVGYWRGTARCAAEQVPRFPERERMYGSRIEPRMRGREFLLHVRIAAGAALKGVTFLTREDDGPVIFAGLTLLGRECDASTVRGR